MKISGLNERWTAGKVDLARQAWYPLGESTRRTAYTTLDPREGDQHLVVGNLVSTDHPDLWLTLLPPNADGSTAVDVHNPTDQPVNVAVRVGASTFLAKAQEHRVTVSPAATTRLILIR